MTDWQQRRGQTQQYHIGWDISPSSSSLLPVSEYRVRAQSEALLDMFTILHSQHVIDGVLVASWFPRLPYLRAQKGPEVTVITQLWWLRSLAEY